MKKLLLILCCLPLLMVAQTEKRLALVIGNSDYKHLSKLPNPVGDALLIAETLDSLGFEVILDTNIKTKRIIKEKASPERLQRDRLVTEARLTKEKDMPPLIGQILTQMGYVTNEQLEQALLEQEKPTQELR